MTQHLKISFAPIADPETKILILGTMPGEKSLALNEYYGHPQNRFWRTLAAITNQQIPSSYAEKKQLLSNAHIGVWDVAHKAHRIGSLDSAIKQEEPNDLKSFISAHKKLQVIGFNGKLAEKLYDKYFERVDTIRYVSLPSTSPANAGTGLEALCEKWKQLLKEE